MEFSVSSKYRKLPPDKTTTYVYGLVCPITNEIFYVGKTVDPQARLEAHASGHPYFSELAKHDQEYTFRLVILEQVPSSEYRPERETYWIIKTLESGAKLTNYGFPTRVPRDWMKWLDEICAKQGWNNRKSSNNRVERLPEYGV